VDAGDVERCAGSYSGSRKRSSDPAWKGRAHLIRKPQFGGNAWSRGFVAPAWGPDPVGLGDAASSTRAGGQALMQIAPYTGPAAPFVAAAGAITTFISSFLQPNIPKEVASARVDEIEADFMKPNLERWWAIPQELRTREVQQAALDVFNRAWAGVIQFCSSIQLGSAGVNCVKDRQRGGRYDWWSYFYDPIANDPHVAQNEEAAQQKAAEEAAAASVLNAGAIFPGPSQNGGGANSTTGSSQTYLYLGLALFAIAGLVALGDGD
jgi:hypothetical protein